jgi:hypothetical protein
MGMFSPKSEKFDWAAILAFRRGSRAVTRRDGDEWLDVVLKHSLQNEAVINREIAKSINAADWNSVPHRLRGERFFCIAISGNTGVEIKHFDALSEREHHWINLKVSGVYAQKHSFVIIFMPNRKPQNHFFGTRPKSKEKMVGPWFEGLYCRTVEIQQTKWTEKIHFHV